MVYCTYNMLNMFRALLCPSSGARDYMCVVTAYGVQCFVAGCRESSAGQQAMCTFVQHPSSWTHLHRKCYGFLWNEYVICVGYVRSFYVKQVVYKVTAGLYRVLWTGIKKWRFLTSLRTEWANLVLHYRVCCQRSRRLCLIPSACRPPLIQLSAEWSLLIMMFLPLACCGETRLLPTNLSNPAWENQNLWGCGLDSSGTA